MNTWEFKGGSLNDIHVYENKIVKSYHGNIDRGFEKLRKESAWLNKIGPIIKKNYPNSLPSVIDFIDDTEKGITELHIEKFQRQSITKLILLGNDFNINTFQNKFELSLQFLMRELYPLATGSMPSYEIYKIFHAKRLALARRYFKTIPYLSPILNASVLLVNNKPCPSINEFLSWLDANAKNLFMCSNLFTVHGNFHLDNILTTNKPEYTFDEITFIDPRGDFLGPVHYDFSKVLISLEGYYDEIHYELFNLHYNKNGRIFSMNIEIDDTKGLYYSVGLETLIKYTNEFSKLEGTNRNIFILTSYTVACIHILSFIFYHAYRETTPPDRIRAFFSLYALFARRVMDMYHGIIPTELPLHRLQFN